MVGGDLGAAVEVYVWYRAETVVVHLGKGLDGGHYVAYRRDDTAGEGWVCVDDDKVVECGAEDLGGRERGPLRERPRLAAKVYLVGCHQLLEPIEFAKS